MLLGRGEAHPGSGQRVLGRKTVEYMMTNHLEPGVLVPAGFLHAFEGVGFGIGGSVTVDPARNALIGSSNQWSWGGAANTYMNIDLEEGLAFVMLTQVTPSFTLCQWRRDLTNLIQACLVDDAPQWRTAGRL
jgi:CubicO group peptidase (beta-lactamase class C family)